MPNETFHFTPFSLNPGVGLLFRDGAPVQLEPRAVKLLAGGGEIDAMDPGGYGAVTITKSITIDGGGFVSSTLHGGVNPTYGFLVNDSGANSIVVTLRNLQVNGFGNGVDGIKFISGKTLNVENCQIFGNGAAAPDGVGIRVALTATGANLNVKNTNIFKNRVGISATTSTGNFTMNVNGSNIENNTGDGIFLDARAFGTIRKSNIAFNGGAGVSLNNSANNSATVEDTELSHNSLFGIFVGSTATARLGRSLISQNGTNFSNSGSIVTFCNNDTETPTLPGSVSQQCQK